MDIFNLRHGENMKYKYKITLFTPTYNRGYIISRLYESIKRQTFRDFEWIIFDDGSTDDTENLVNIWKSENKDFPIIYIKGKTEVNAEPLIVH